MSAQTPDTGELVQIVKASMNEMREAALSLQSVFINIGLAATMPFKDPAKKAKWRIDNPDKTRLYKARWKAGAAGRAYMERLIAEAAVKRAAKVRVKGKRETRRMRGAEWRRDIRLAAIARLGGECARCGIDDERVLEFDHIVPLLRRSTGRHNSKDNHNARVRLLSGDDGHGLQLLCANCHSIKTREGNEWALRFGLAEDLDDGRSTIAQFDLFGDDDE